jgi:hypothetical protein
MPKQHLTLLFLGLLIAAVAGAIAFVPTEAEYAGLACSDKRVITYGWTHPDRSRAELAAIVRWKETTQKRGAAFAEWHHAQNRHMKCRTIGGPNGQYQCTVSALPCELAKAETGSAATQTR